MLNFNTFGQGLHRESFAGELFYTFNCRLVKPLYICLISFYLKLGFRAMFLSLVVLCIGSYS